MHQGLLQIHSTLIGTGLLSPETMLFNRPIRGLLPEMNRDPINVNNNDVHYEALEAHQRKNSKGKNTQKHPSVSVAGATVAVQ